MIILASVLIIIIKSLVALSAIVVFLYLLDRAHLALQESDMPNTTEADEEIPSIYVNKDLLSDEEFHIGAEYIVNDQVFRESTSSYDDGLAEFEVFQMEPTGDMYCSTPDDSENGDFNESHLACSLQQLPNGYVVNGNCFLTWQQWHTLVTPHVSVRLLHCVVCSQYCEVDASRDHIVTVNHRLALEAYPPLDKFDLSIVRKINNLYHCAVCNEKFDISSESDHFSSKMHEGNQLFAINKASDILDNSVELNNDKNDDRIDTYHFKTHAMNSTMNDDESIGSNDNCNYNYVNFQNNYYFDDDYEEETPAFTGLSYATMAKKPKVNIQSFIDIDLGHRKVTIRYDSWHMVISPKPNRLWCMVCKTFEHLRKKQHHCSQHHHLQSLSGCPVIDRYHDHFIRQVDDKLYHCGHCNNLQMIHEMDDHIEKEHPRKKPANLVSDAKKPANSPAKQLAKPNANSPRKNEANGNLQNNINGAKNITQKEPTVIKRISYEEFMKTFRDKANNKENKAHNANASINNDKTINNNIINDNKLSQEKHVTNNNYNNINAKLPVINTRNDIHHTNNTKTDSTLNALNNNLSVTNTKTDIQKVGTNTKTDIQKGGTNTKTDIPNGVTKDYSRPILDSITIFPFGYNITLPWFSYNIVCKRPNDYYCGLCNVVLPEADIVNHMYEVKHLELLQRTPFIAPFSYNLIRAIRDALHCAICNVPITAASIYIHIEDPQHKDNVHKALNHHTTSKLPPIGVKMPNVPEKPVENNNSHNKSQNTINNNVSNLTKSTESNTNSHSQNITNESTENDEIQDEYVDDNDEEYYEDDDSDICDEIDRTFDSIPSEDASFDEEEHVYLKLKNSYIKISNTSYNTLVHIGDGSRYCFVCSIKVQYMELQKHVDAREHLDNIGKYMFLDKYEDHLLRQIYLMYHCGICNVIITRKELKTHLEWPAHALANVNLKNIKKTRKTEIKGGVKQIVVSTTKENIYLHDNEPKIKICLNAEVTDKKPKKAENKDTPKQECSKKNKIIIFNDNVLKVSWESWNAISKIKNGYKCILCQRELKSADIDVHCTSEWHRYGLDKPFEKQYAPALIRKINDSTLNCVFCNTEISNKEHLVTVHVNGKKHQKNFEEILKESSQANTYTDCNDDVLML